MSDIESAIALVIYHVTEADLIMSACDDVSDEEYETWEDIVVTALDLLDSLESLSEQS